MLPTVVMGLALLALIIVLPYYLMFMSGRARLVSSIPGPIPLPFIGNALEFGMNGVDLLRIMISLRHKFGSIVRCWLGPYLVVSITDPRHAEIFLTSKTNIKKSMQYRFLEDMGGKGLVTSSGNKWRSDRKLLNPAFHFSILKDFLSVFNSQASVLTQKLEKEVGGSEFDIYRYLTLCTLDISCETSMGVRMNIQDYKNNEYLEAVSSVEACVIQRCLRPWLYPDFIFNLTELGKRQKTYLKILHDTSEKIIQRKKREVLVKENESENVEHENEREYKKRSAFLDLLLQHERNGYLTDVDIQDQVGTFLLAVGIVFCLADGLCVVANAQERETREEEKRRGKEKKEKRQRKEKKEEEEETR
ncbi:Uncharacterized protein GBIM_13260 [Gryllus bimaculatus]|nr:Uncharacterized protein GBIM_13260 [Gryllus bimaculatus]